MKLSKVVAIASLCAAFAVSASAQTSTSTTTSSKSSKTSGKTSTTKSSTSTKTKTAGDAVKPADLPAPVTQTVMAAHPKGTITSAMKMMKGTDTVYSVSVKDGVKTSKMTVGADGKMAAAAPAMTTTKKKTSTTSTTTK